MTDRQMDRDGNNGNKTLKCDRQVDRDNNNGNKTCLLTDTSAGNKTVWKTGLVFLNINY